MLVVITLLAFSAQQLETGAKADAARDADRIDEAIGLYRQALGGRPNWTEGWWSLGTLLYERDDYAAAAVALRRTVKLNPQGGNAFVMLGLCEAKLGRSGAAISDIERGRQLDGGADPRIRPVMLYTLGILLLEAGKFGQAQEVGSRASGPTLPKPSKRSAWRSSA